MRLFPGPMVALLVLLPALAVSGQSSRDEIKAPVNEPPTRFDSITNAIRTGRFAEALDLLEPVLRQSPSNPQLWTLEGLAYAGEGHKKDALESFQKALKISPDYLPAVEGAAQTAYDTGSPQATRLLQHVLKLVPRDPTAHAMLASLAFKNHNCAEAVSHFEQSGSLLKSEPVALRQYGICLAMTKRSREAEEVFRSLVAIPGDDSQDRVRLAALQLSSGKPGDAIQSLRPALDNHPDSDVLALAAEAYEEQKDTPQAVELLHQAIVQSPRDLDLYLQFADLSIIHQSFQVGVDMMSAGLKLEPDEAPLYLARGILYVQLADYDHAEADFERANELDPRHAVSDAARGMLAEQKDDLDKALSVVRTRLAKRPDDALLLYVEADILVQKNPDVDSPEFNQAIVSAKRATGLQPGLVAARDTLAKLYLQAGKNQLAVEESRASLEHDPSDQVALYHLIVGLRKTGHSQELPPLLERLADLRQKATREEGERNRYKLIEQTETNNPAR